MKRAYITQDELIGGFLWTLILGISFTLLLVNANGFTATQEELLDLQCNYYNLTFSECQEYRNLFISSYTISNETAYINTIKAELEELIDDKFKESEKLITSVNTSIDNLDFSRYNDTNLFTGLKSSIEDNLSQLREQFDLQYADSELIDYNQIYLQETKKLANLQKCKIQAPTLDCDEIFGVKKKSIEETLNLSLYVLKSEIPSNLNAFAMKTDMPDTSIYIEKNIFFLLIAIIGFIVGFIYFIEIKKLKDSIAISRKVIVPEQFEDTKEYSKSENSKKSNNNLG